MYRVVYRTKLGLVGMGSSITRLGDLDCRVRRSNMLMMFRRIGQTDAEASTIPCVFVTPTIVPARMKRSEPDEVAVRCDGPARQEP